MADHAALVAPVYPVQRVIRTVLVDVVVWGPTLALAVPVVLDAAGRLRDAGTISPALYAQVAGLGAAALVVSGLVSRLIALPRINGLLTRLGAGTVPRRAARAQVVEVVKDTRAALELLGKRAS